jgi:hypothetical protein
LHATSLCGFPSGLKVTRLPEGAGCIVLLQLRIGLSSTSHDRSNEKDMLIWLMLLKAYSQPVQIRELMRISNPYKPRPRE